MSRTPMTLAARPRVALCFPGSGDLTSAATDLTISVTDLDSRTPPAVSSARTQRDDTATQRRKQPSRVRLRALDKQHLHTPVMHPGSTSGACSDPSSGLRTLGTPPLLRRVGTNRSQQNLDWEGARR